jgi:hypothetical protein
VTCSNVTLPGGGFAIVCAARGRPKRCACGRPATLLCDWKVPTKRSGTCDKPICSGCSTNPEANGRINFDKDLCPAHAAEFETWRSKRDEGISHHDARGNAP